MLVHSIAGLLIGMDYKYPRMINQSAAYLCKPKKTDFNIMLSKEELYTAHKENPHLSIDECEYMITGFIFYRNLVNFNGMLLHASAVFKDGYAYLFSAPSGTGKSTHTSLWLKNFPDAKILNDDKPALRIIDGEVKACGTPWSGKSNLNVNICLPIAGICFLERSQDNYIHKITSDKAIPLMLNQTVRPKMLGNMDKLLNTLGRIIEKVDIYRMGCNMEDAAALLSYETMKK